MPETETPETDTPDTDVPETETPETDTPDTDVPETNAPETETPETKTPETETTTPVAPISETDTAAPAPSNDGDTGSRTLASTGASVIGIGVAALVLLGAGFFLARRKKD